MNGPTRSPHRRGRWLLAALAALSLPAFAPAQRLPARIEPRPVEFATGEEDNLFSLQRSEEDIHEWELALAEIDAGEHVAAAERLHRLLQADHGGVVPIAPGRFLGLRVAVLSTMANMPSATAEAYEALVQREAGNLAERRLQDLGRDQLELLAHRFPASSLGRRARLRLGDLALEAGDGRTAADHYRLLIDAMPIGSKEERMAVLRLHDASVLAQPGRARADAAARRLPPSGEDLLAVLPPAADDATHAAIGDRSAPMAEPAGRPAPVLSEAVDAQGFDRREMGQFAMFPVGDLDGLFVNTGRELVVFDPLRGDFAWKSPSPLEDAPHSGDDPGEHVNTGMVLSAALGGDVVVAALQVPDTSVNVDFQASFRIISKIPQRRLYAFSRTTGKLLWSHFDELEGPRTRRFRGHDACGPPLVVGDTVYAPVHDRSGAIAFSVAAYDLATGEVRWRRLVCSSQQDVNMFGNALSEFAASPLAVDGGVLYGSSNLGVAYAIERKSGALRWITSYEVVRMPRTMLHGQADRPVYFANNAPAIADGVVCMTPLDSMYVLGFDTETGAPMWRLSTDATVAGTENRVRWLAGALDDEFVLAGRGAVAVTARPDVAGDRPPVRQLVRPEALRSRDVAGSARPAVTADHVWFPAGDRILGFDRAGNPLGDEAQIALPHHHAGNLLLVDGIVVSLRQRAFDVLLDPAALVGRVEARVATAGDDAAAILRLARLRHALADKTGAPPGDDALAALFERGLEACERQGMPASHPVRLALQRELFEHLLERAEMARRLGGPRAVERLLAARDAAPDARAFVRVQELVLEAVRDRPAERRAELERLERMAPDETFPHGAGVPVRAWVAWQRALLPDLSPAEAVAAWQRLLESHGSVPLDGTSAAAVAEAALARLLAEHGRAIYADVEARAAAALAAAGDDARALREVGVRYPNSTAAVAARTRLLDRSVREGDLALACEVLAQGLRGGDVAPGILRRVGVAATQRGNHGLATAMHDRLRAHAAERSDWPDDAGATYGDVLRRIGDPAPVGPPAALPSIPHHEITRVLPRSPRQVLRVVHRIVAPGFATAEPPLLCTTGTELLAFDVFAPGAAAPVVYGLPIEFLEHVIVCGGVLVVPDLQRVVGLDLTTGTVSWQLPADDDERFAGVQFDSLGVERGVVLLAARSGLGDGTGELIGVEPLSGTVLYRRTLPGGAAQPMPKVTAGRLIAMETTNDGGARLHDLDPVTGDSVHTTVIAPAVLQEHLRLRPGELSTWMYPQGLAADRDHVFLPVEGTAPGEAPRVVAVDRSGAIAWHWTGRPGTWLKVLQRDGRLALVEGHDRLPGRVLLLSASDGRVLREAQLGAQPHVLNWQRSWHDNPAPAILALSDRPDPSMPHRRFVAFAIDDGLPTFEVPLANDDGEVEAQPVFGPDFVTFGVRLGRRAALRLYTLRLADRSGALPDGAKHQRIDLRSAQYGVATFGAYTVVSGTEGIAVLGPESPR